MVKNLDSPSRRSEFTFIILTDCRGIKQGEYLMNHDKTDNKGRTHALRRCFAVVNDLTPRFEVADISTDDVWNWVRTSHNVESRSEMTEKQLTLTHARLCASQENVALFSVLCHDIQQASLKEEAVFSITQRVYPEASKVDVTLESGQRHSQALVDIQKKTVRGREFEIRRIVEHITNESSGSYTREMMNKAVLARVLESVATPVMPTEQYVKEVLMNAQQWLQVDTIAEKCGIDDIESVLVALRVLYRQKQIIHRQIGDNRWFRTSGGY